jgi:hypothetical protein
MRRCGYLIMLPQNPVRAYGEISGIKAKLEKALEGAFVKRPKRWKETETAPERLIRSGAFVIGMGPLHTGAGQV